MSRFASRENTRAEQHTIHRELESLLGAVEVTGLSGWERTKKLYGTGLAEGTSYGTGLDCPTSSTRRVADYVGRDEKAVPSASSVQTSLFEGEEAA